MSDMKAVKVLRTVRVAETGNHYGREIVKGTEDKVPDDMFAALEAEGYVEAVGAKRGGKGALRDDGPTIAEYVAGGYSASDYPPHGYASRSTPEEIADAVKAAKGNEAAAKKAAKLRDAILADLMKLSDEDLAKVVDAEKIAVDDGDSKDVVLGKVADARMAQG